MDKINVIIKFFGPIESVIGRAELSASIRADRSSGLTDICNIIRNEAGKEVLFSILINGSSIDLCKKERFDEHDTFSIIPIVLGG